MISRICLLVAAVVSVVSEKPNIVVLYSDDVGYADFGFQPGCAAEMKELTPNIDRIASEGARFSNASMAGSVCSPSRAGLMTGRYQQRFGYDNNLPLGFQSGLELKETFGAKRMQKLGYQTGLVGKWHLGYPAEYHPNKRGFDLFYGLLQGARPYFELKKASAHRAIQENGKVAEEKGYVTDRFGDAACRFIKENKAKPFYLFVSFTAPHGPQQPKPEDAKRTAHIENKKRASYAGLIVSLDDNVGKVDPAWKLDGESFWPLINGRPQTRTATKAPRALYWRQHVSKGPRAMREGKWKLLGDRKSGQAPALYDLSVDEGESRDLSAANEEVCQAMLEKIEVWESQLEEPRWGPGAPAQKEE